VPQPSSGSEAAFNSSAPGNRTAGLNIVRVTVRGGARFGSSGGAQRVLSRKVWRGAQASPITERRSCLPFISANNGVLDAYEVQTGTEVYRARVPAIGSGFSASPVAADGKIYLSNEDGAVAVIAADRTVRHVATNDMGAPIMATPALSRGVLFVRTMNSVFAIGRKP
jgi:outer membrane protein assembly factor BamB